MMSVHLPADLEQIQGRVRQQPATFTCLIPFHNERERIAAVLRVAMEVAGLSQVVCIDDGSTDDGAALVEASFPQVTLVRLPTNCGKAAAMSAGLYHATTSHVLLLDADLRSLQAQEINQALDRILRDPAIDMIILRRVRAAWNARISRGDVLYSGERLLRTSDLRRILEAPITGYQVEIAINQYMHENGKAVYWMPSSATNTIKLHKVGVAAGLKSDVIMIKEMLDYSGFSTYVEQFLTFARKPALETGVPRRRIARPGKHHRQAG